MQIGMIGLARCLRVKTTWKKRGALWNRYQKKNTPIYPYAPKTWGLEEVERVAPPGGRPNPSSGQEAFTVADEATA
jgi:hypothetical protein